MSIALNNVSCVLMLTVLEAKLLDTIVGAHTHTHTHTHTQVQAFSP